MGRIQVSVAHLIITRDVGTWVGELFMFVRAWQEGGQPPVARSHGSLKSELPDLDSCSGDTFRRPDKCPPSPSRSESLLFTPVHHHQHHGHPRQYHRPSSPEVCPGSSYSANPPRTCFATIWNVLATRARCKRGMAFPPQKRNGKRLQNAKTRSCACAPRVSSCHERRGTSGAHEFDTHADTPSMY